MTMTTITKLSHADTMRRFELSSCDFVYNCETGIEFSVYAQGSEPNTETTETPRFSYDNQNHVEAIKEICLAIVDDGFPDIHNIAEVGGNFHPDGDQICFEGEVTAAVHKVTYVS